MSGEEPDEEASAWDEIDEFTSAEPADEEESVVDAEIVDRDEPNASGSRPQADDSDGQSPSGSWTQPGNTEPVARDNPSDEHDPATTPRSDQEPLDESGSHEGHTDRGADPQTTEPAVDDVPIDAEDAPDADEVFDKEDVSDVDGEALWDELAGGGSTAAAGTAAESAATETATAEQSVEEPTTGSVGGQPGGSPGGDDEETLVDKRQYCQQCPYFTDPPEVGCTHPGTEIVEVVEDGRFRVRDCPVVTETGPDRTILDGGE